jgi:hypothetical protein
MICSHDICRMLTPPIFYIYLILLKINIPILIHPSAATIGSVSDYNVKLKELAEKLKSQQPAMAVLNGMADEIKAIKLSAPKSSVGSASAQLQEAMATAKQLTEEKGVTSSEAQVAWDIVEEIASSGSGNAMGGMMTEEECLVDAAMEACEALEELSRALDKSE